MNENKVIFRWRPVGQRPSRKNAADKTGGLTGWFCQEDKIAQAARFSNTLPAAASKDTAGQIPDAQLLWLITWTYPAVRGVSTRLRLRLGEDYRLLEWRRTVQTVTTAALQRG